jgi:allantoinase
MSARRPGMDHPHYDWSPLPGRARLAWPGGARVAFSVVVHVEHWELEPPADAVRDARFVSEFGPFSPDYRTWSQREYGNRVGISRILRTLDRHGIRATVALGAAAAERYPPIVEECRRRGYEFVGHGSHATRLLSAKMDEAAERRFIAASLDAVERATGARPRGWLGQDHGESARTPRLLAEAGLDYVLDWANDEQPYLMTTDPPLVAVPSQVEWDDVQLFWIRRVDSWRYPALLAEALEVLLADGAATGRCLSLAVHPWLFGMAHRIRYLNEALAAIAARDGVWQATAGEIAAAYRATLA